MNPKIIFIIVSLIIGILGSFVYLKDIISLKTKPHIYTWVIWVMTQGTAVTGIWYGGGSWGALNLTIGVFINACVALFSLKYGTKNITLSDTIIFIAALGAILVWWQLDKPVLSIFMVAAIDVVGYIPSYRKSYLEPWSETLIAWAAFTIAHIFAIFALSEYNLLTMSYLVSIIFANILLFLICYIRRFSVPKPA